MCQDRDALYRKLGGGRPTCHFFNSFFINKLYKDQRKYCYSALPGTTAQAGPLQDSVCVGRRQASLASSVPWLASANRKGMYRVCAC